MINRALFVGIDRYDAPGERFGDLAGCVRDMRLMRETMTELGGLLPADTEELTDGQATTTNLIAAIERLTDGLRSGEQAFLFYAGHGGQVPNATPTPDDPEALDETLVPHDFSRERPLLDDILRAKLCVVPDGARVTVVLDSCHSGGMARAPMSSADTAAWSQEGWAHRSIGVISRAEYSPTQLAALEEHKARHLTEGDEVPFLLLAAAQPHESAWERVFDGGKHGIFTYHLCEGLRAMGRGASPIALIDHAYGSIQAYRENQMPRLVGPDERFRAPLFPA